MKRVALLECEDAEKWKGATEALWKSQLFEEGDAWDIFKCPAGEFPTPEAAASYDFMLVGGSHYSAYEDIPWINDLARLLPQYVQRKARIIGCCFGAQLLAKALGGSVGPNPSGRFVLHMEHISMTPAALQHPQLLSALTAAGPAAAEPPADRPTTTSATTHTTDTTTTDSSSSGQLPSLRLLESHGDQVLALPPGATTLATSPTASHELWAYGGCVLAFQFHIEFGGRLAHEKIWPAIKAAGSFTEEEAQQSEQSLLCCPTDDQAMLRLVKHFIQHGLEGPGQEQPGSSTAALAMSLARLKVDSTAEDATSSGAAATGTTAPAAVAAAQASSSPAAAKAAEPQAQPSAAEAAAGPGTDTQEAGTSPPSATSTTSPQPTTAGHEPPGPPAVQVPLPHPPPLSIRPPQQPPSPGPPSTTASSVGGLSAFSGAFSAFSSASGLIPFSVLEGRRRQHTRREQRQEQMAELLKHTEAAADAQMEAQLSGCILTTTVNTVAAKELAAVGDAVDNLAAFARGQVQRQAVLQDSLAQLPQLHAQLLQLQAVVDKLDRGSQELLEQCGLKEEVPASGGLVSSLTSPLRRLFRPPK